MMTMVEAFAEFLSEADIQPEELDPRELRVIKAAFVHGLKLGASIVQIPHPAACTAVDKWADEVEAFWGEPLEDA